MIRRWAATAFLFVLVSLSSASDRYKLQVTQQQIDSLRAEMTWLLEEKDQIADLPAEAAERATRLKRWRERSTKFEAELERLSALAASDVLRGAKMVADARAARSQVTERVAIQDAKVFQVLWQGSPAAYDATIVKRFQRARKVIGAGAKGDIWSHPDGTFACLGQNRWEETGDGFKNSFTEIERAKNYVELVKPMNRQETRFVIVRIYDDRCWVKQPNDPTFAEYYQGRWSMPAK